MSTTTGARERLSHHGFVFVLQVGFIASLKNEMKHDTVSKVRWLISCCSRVSEPNVLVCWYCAGSCGPWMHGTSRSVLL